MKIRNEFPELNDVVYLNNAAMTLMPLRSKEAFSECLNDRRFSGEKRTKNRDLRELSTREKIAELIGASTDEICIVTNTSEGLNIFAQGLRWKPGDNVVIARHGFPGNIMPWLNLEKRGVIIKIAETEYGTDSTDKLLNEVDEKTRVLALIFHIF